jgi:ABC-type glycerol-3-phosphate transport system substrate-binding protein
MTQSRRISRRNALKVGAAAAALPLVHIRTAAAAGSLSLGLWDHWVPAGNGKMKEIVGAWAEKNKVDVKIDFITSVGNKNLLTIAAEAQAKTGHDVLAFPTWEIHNNQDLLEPMDDVMDALIKQYGDVNPVCTYLGQIKGHWLAVPSSVGTQNKPSCGRLSFFKTQGIDLETMYPAKDGGPAMADNWTWEKLIPLAAAAKKAGLGFGLGLGQTTDSVDWVGAMFHSYGADLVDAKGNVTVKTDAVRQVLDVASRLARELPEDVYSYDDASNNRALISGKSAMIFNPPSAYAVAKKDAPQIAADCWTFPNPAGPKGRHVPYLPYFWGVWKFSKNKATAKELLTFLCQREQAEALSTAVSGYDIPPFLSMSDFKVWAEVEPPKGTVYNYPIRPWHHSTPSIAAAPAPAEIAVQIYNRATMTTMIAKVAKDGQKIDEVLAWAQNEVEGFTR